VRARTKARKLALDILFQSELRGVDPGVVLLELGERTGPVGIYARELVTGVADNQLEIDAKITELSKDWAIERMPGVDRNLLRIAIFEMTKKDDVPESVAISEAIELATELSTAQSPVFINGVLGALAKSTP
jgi:N utilization substance protein B